MHCFRAIFDFFVTDLEGQNDTHPVLEFQNKKNEKKEHIRNMLAINL